MDRLRLRRPGTKTPSQITKTTFENTAPVQRLSFWRARSGRELQPSGIGRLVLRGVQRAVLRNNSRMIANSNNPVRTALLARRIPIDMSLPGEESPSVLGEFIKRDRWRRLRLAATTGLALALVLVITLGGLIFSENYIRLHKVFRGTATADSISKKVNLLNGQASGRINVLLLGRDGDGAKQPDVTDTMIVASIDVVNNDVTFISLPGNLWVNNSSGAMEISNTFEKGDYQYSSNFGSSSADTKAIDAGFKLADQSVSGVLGVSIGYNVIVNFQALQQIVDNLGGITVNVPTTLTDPTMAWQNGGNAVLAQVGNQNFSGKQALLYAMSKETTSETDREQRQRAVLSAIFSKAISSGAFSKPTTINDLLGSLGNNVASDLSMTDAAKLCQLVAPISSSNVTSSDLFTNNSQYLTTGLMAGQSIVLPSTGLFNYSQLISYVATQLPNPYLAKEDAGILILNGTNTPGLATTLGNKLSNEGYNVIGVANTPGSNWPKTVLYNVQGGNNHTQKYLEKYLKLNVSSKSLNKSIPTDGADFVIIIGNDETSHS